MTGTSLSTALSADGLTAVVASATGATVGGFIKIDDEIAVVAAISGTSIGLRFRGSHGTRAYAHLVTAPVLFGTFDELLDPGAGAQGGVSDDQDVLSVSADGAFDVALLKKRRTTVVINKAGVCALTLAAPSKDQNGQEVTFLSGTANAHTITYTAGFYGDTTASDVATYAAKAGASMTIIARDGTWGVKSLANVTLA